MRDVAIIGAGPSGLQAGIYLASEGFDVVICERERIGGQIVQTPLLENFAGQSERGVSGQTFINRMKRQAIALGCKIEISEVHDFSDVAARCHIIACGQEWDTLKADGVDEQNGKNFFYGPSRTTKVEKGGRYTVAGAGNSSGQAIIELATHAERVDVLCRSNLHTMSAYLQHRILNSPNVHVHYNCQLTRINKTGCSAKIDGVKTRIRCDYTFLCGSKHPNSDWLKQSIQLTDKGFVVTGFYGYNVSTSKAGVFAIGDIRAEAKRKSVGNAVADANTVVLDVFKFLRNQTGVSVQR